MDMSESESVEHDVSVKYGASPNTTLVNQTSNTEIVTQNAKPSNDNQN